jgi:hypothetical protein
MGCVCNGQGVANQEVGGAQGQGSVVWRDACPPVGRLGLYVCQFPLCPPPPALLGGPVPISTPGIVEEDRKCLTMMPGSWVVLRRPQPWVSNCHVSSKMCHLQYLSKRAVVMSSGNRCDCANETNLQVGVPPLSTSWTVVSHPSGATLQPTLSLPRSVTMPILLLHSLIMHSCTNWQGGCNCHMTSFAHT